MKHRIDTTNLTRRLLWLGVLLAGASPVAAGAYYIGVDVPSDLDGTNYLTSECLLDDNGMYSVAEALPAGTALGAMHREPDGTWMFSPADPARLGGADYEPRDVVSFDGAVYSLALDGSVAEIPDYARIDGLHVAGGEFQLSFDVPVKLGGTEYGPSDVVAYNGTFSLIWDAASAGVAIEANLVGLSRDWSGSLQLTFDVPVTLDGATHLPGTVVRWDGGTSFSVQVSSATWPASSQFAGLSMLPAAGSVPDGGAFPGNQLTVDKAAGGDVTLSWGASCGTDDNDYEIYEGTLGGFTSHVPSLCSTGGVTSQTLTPGAGSVYFLVAPHNDWTEGSYGLDSAGTERPHLAGACLPQQTGVCG